MSATVLNKYVGVSFGGRTGSLVITSEKLIFRPKVTASEKAANVKPGARSWRWAAIDRMEILDPSRSAHGAKLRSFKLKPRTAGHKTVTLTIPSEKLEDVVDDVNQRLSSSALGVEGILPSKKKVVVAPSLPRNPVRAPVGKNVVMSDNAVQNTPEPKKTVTTTMVSKPKEPITPTVSKSVVNRDYAVQKAKEPKKTVITKTTTSTTTMASKPKEPITPTVNKNVVNRDNVVQNTQEPKKTTTTTIIQSKPRESIINPKEKAMVSKKLPQTPEKSVANTKAAIKQSPQRNIVLATPPQPSKPKPTASSTKRSSWTPSADLVFTPPTVKKDKPKAAVARTIPSTDLVFTPPTVKKDKVPTDDFVTPIKGNKKDKVQRDIIFTPPQQDKPSAKHFDIEFTPTQKEKGKIGALNKDRGEEDATSVSTQSSSDLPLDKFDEQQQQKPQQRTQSQPQQAPLTGQLWNPEAPEHRFRMMILQHAATCGWDKGTCQYDPICSQQKNILAHIATCTEEEECTVDKCRSTKQFLLTMRLMKEMQQQGNDNAGGANKDFLVGVGAVAPIPVIELPDYKMGCSNHSVVSESTWWSNDWGAVEDDDDGDESD